MHVSAIEILLSLVCLGLVGFRRTPDLKSDALDPGKYRIRCPECGWEPQKHDRWYCEPGCLCRWNTFETAGICPGCQKHWDETACLSCHRWSPHADWYEPGR